MVYQIPANVPHDIFRTYDIRGATGEGGITPDVAYAIGLSIGSEARERQISSMVVGRDGRLSGPELKEALMTGLCDTGVDVVDVGVVPTPLVYFATNYLTKGISGACSRDEEDGASKGESVISPLVAVAQVSCAGEIIKGNNLGRLRPSCLTTNSGVMLTASHNPANHNGFKIVLAGRTVSMEGVQAVYQRIQEKRFVSGHGKRSEHDITSDYLAYVTDQIQLERPLKVVVDCGNGIAGQVAPVLYRQLGCEVIELFCEVDGRFPNHHPDPTVPENLKDIIAAVKKENADVGLAFDGDADRLGVVTNQGEIIWPDRQLILFSQDVLSRHAGAKIVFDVKCTGLLPKAIEEHGGKPIMYRTGHSMIKAKMIEEGAILAGEMSGHIFFKEHWFGFDDGIYVGARLLKILSQDQRSCSEIFSALPDSFNTPELKLPMSEDKKPDFMRRLLEHAQFEGAQRITIDGLRVEYPYGWGLIRPSNTSPYLILRFEADSDVHLEQIKETFRRKLLEMDSSLSLPF